MDESRLAKFGLNTDQFQAALSYLQETGANTKFEELKGSGFTKRDIQQDNVRRHIEKKYDFLYVESINQYLYREKSDMGGNHSFKRLTDAIARAIVAEAYREMFNIAPADKVTATTETLKTNITKHIGGIKNNIIQLNNDIYWDVEAGEIIDHESKPCMRELFDSRGSNEVKIKLSEISTSSIEYTYGRTLKHLNEHDGAIDPDAAKSILSRDGAILGPFWTWANYDADTFNDLLKAVASNFMHVKPKGAFVLIGLKRNGKSTFLKMLHILFGRNNTSSVRLSDFNNHGLNGDLWTTMMNAPDEEDEGRGKDLLEAQGNFKSIAAHESLKLRKLYEQNGQWVNSDFMCFFPMNHFPEWKGNGAAACMHRTLPLFFNNDLSKFDNTGHDFVRETFTPFFFSHLIGVALAFAHYYHDKEMPFSSKMKKDKKVIEAEVDNISLYLDRFRSWFNGYKSKKLLFEDYKLWCRERDLRWQEYSVFSHSLEMRGPKITSLTTDDARFNVYRLGERSGNDFFYEDFYVPQLHKRIIEIITTDTEKKRLERSVVAMLDELKDANSNKPVKEDKKSDNQQILDDIKEIGW